MPYKDPAKKAAANKRSRQLHPEANREAVKRHKAKTRRLLEAYKRGLSCVRCGYDRSPDALDFHHRDPSTKTATIRTMLRGTYSWERISREIDKCEVLCANCHRELHSSERENARSL